MTERQREKVTYMKGLGRKQHWEYMNKKKELRWKLSMKELTNQTTKAGENGKAGKFCWIWFKAEEDNKRFSAFCLSLFLSCTCFAFDVLSLLVCLS